ncbi:MAG: sulfatase-like hydrolase/transferase [Elusimicrobiales bacterium]|nr:sulfatase-like hydrolase/transferase [Elusimicrobiales bacterium]
MTRKRSFGLLFMFLFSPLQAPAAGKLNVIFLDICSTRADHFGTYGYHRDTTPNMDAFGKSGVVFENAMAEGSWCLPSYASLLTGHVPEVHGLYSNLPGGKLPDFETTLAAELGRAGYRTALFSGGVYLLPEWGLAAGFDTYTNIFSTASPSRIPAPFEDNLAAVLGWVKQNKSDPFFLFATIDDLHTPYHSADPEKYDPGYQGLVHDPDVLGVPFSRAYNGQESGYPPALMRKVKEFKSDPRHLRHMVAHYDAALNGVDARVGEFLAELRRLGLEENTVLIISADHGEMLGEKGLINHTQSLYEPVLRVPLLVKHPGEKRTAGSRLKQLVQRIDLMPTILEIAGASQLGLGLQGRSFVPLLKDPSAPWREYAFARNRRNIPYLAAGDAALDERVARDGCWKLHHYLYKDAWELYDLCSDPLETRDLAAERPDITARLAFQLVKNLEESRPHRPGPPAGLDRTLMEVSPESKN